MLVLRLVGQDSRVEKVDLYNKFQSTHLFVKAAILSEYVPIFKLKDLLPIKDN